MIGKDELKLEDRSMSNDKDTSHYIRINEIKNFLYCPRIPFYSLCLDLDRDTRLARIGIENEQRVKQQMKRRKHALHARHKGQRIYDVNVVHHEYQLIGKLDEIIHTNEGVYLVDYKDTDTDYGYWKIQMLAYRLCVETAGIKVLGCSVYTIPNQTYHDIRTTKHHEKKLHDIVQSLQVFLRYDVCPEPTPHQNKCRTCQYRRFCNDIW